MNISITLPSTCIKEHHKGDDVLAIALNAIDMGLSPLINKHVDTVNIKAYINRQSLPKFKAALPKGMALGDFIAGMVCSFHAQTLKANKKEVSVETLESAVEALIAAQNTQSLSDLQKESLRQAAPSLMRGEISFNEVGTGVGKSRIINTLAYAVSLSVHETSVIAVPTLSVLSHLLAESELIEMPLDYVKPNRAFLLGKSSFVDINKLMPLLLDDEIKQAHNVDPIKDWIKAGAKHAGSKSTKIMHELMPSLAYLVEDLQYIAPDFPVSLVVFDELAESDDDNCLVTPIYKAMREKAKQADIIYCTHAMLSINYIGKATILPQFGYLFVDEAHVLEDAAANLNSSTLNARVLKDEIKYAYKAHIKTAEVKAALSSLDELNKALLSSNSKTDRDVIDLTDPANQLAFAEIKTIMLKTKSALSALSSLDESLFKTHIANPIVALKGITEKANNYAVKLNFSPIRRYPSISSGPRSVSWLLNKMWDSVQGAALFSGTLSIQRLHKVSSNYIRHVLSVPSARSFTCKQIHQQWIYDAKLHEVGKGVNALMPRNTEDDDVSVWYEAVAKEVITVANGAKGGTLVLLTSYEAINEIAKVIESLDKGIYQRLVKQTKQSNAVKAAKAAFESMTNQGHRPIWLAAGNAAWTGLDISNRSVSAEQDFWLTDLVIPRVPFGTNKTSTHASRMEWFKNAETERATLEFRQGLGRLMRRAGLTDRHIWILDARIWSDAYHGWMSGVRNSLKAYY